MSEKVTAMIEEIKGLTVLELSELVHALEEEFGVSAAAMAAPAAGGAAPAAALAARMDSQIAADGGHASPAKNDSASDVGTQPTPEEVIPVTLIPGETTR